MDGYESISDGLLLAAVIIGWASLIDWLDYRFPAWHLVGAREIALVQDGRILRKNLAREQMSEEDLMKANGFMLSRAMTVPSGAVAATGTRADAFVVGTRGAEEKTQRAAGGPPPGDTPSRRVSGAKRTVTREPGLALPPAQPAYWVESCAALDSGAAMTLAATITAEVNEMKTSARTSFLMRCLIDS